ELAQPIAAPLTCDLIEPAHPRVVFVPAAGFLVAVPHYEARLTRRCPGLPHKAAFGRVRFSAGREPNRHSPAVGRPHTFEELPVLAVVAIRDEHVAALRPAARLALGERLLIKIYEALSFCGLDIRGAHDL